MSDNLDFNDVEKMKDDLAGVYGSGPEEEQEKRIGVCKDSRNAPVKARAKQKRFVRNNRHEEDKGRLDGGVDIIKASQNPVFGQLQDHIRAELEQHVVETLCYTPLVFVVAHSHKKQILYAKIESRILENDRLLQEREVNTK